MWLRSQWNKMSANVADLQKIQGKIQEYRPWFDESFHNVSALRQLTRNFPESGEVTAKTLEVRDGDVVTCSGTARDISALLQTLGKLRTADGVSGLKVTQTRGKSPMQFSFDFHWNPGGGI
jgi:Tfp pilus assembly protein PilN